MQVSFISISLVIVFAALIILAVLTLIVVLVGIWGFVVVIANGFPHFSLIRNLTQCFNWANLSA